MKKNNLQIAGAASLLLCIGGVAASIAASGDLNYLLAHNPAEAMSARDLEIIIAGQYKAIRAFTQAGGLYYLLLHFVAYPVKAIGLDGASLAPAAARFGAMLATVGALLISLRTVARLTKNSRTLIPTAALGVFFAPTWAAMTSGSPYSLAALAAAISVSSAIDCADDPKIGRIAIAALAAGVAAGLAGTGLFLAAPLLFALWVGLRKRNASPFTALVEMSGLFGFFLGIFACGLLLAAPQIAFAPELVGRFLLAGGAGPPTDPFQFTTGATLAGFFTSGFGAAAICCLIAVILLITALVERGGESNSARPITAAIALLAYPVAVVIRSFWGIADFNSAAVMAPAFIIAAGLLFDRALESAEGTSRANRRGVLITLLAPALLGVAPSLMAARDAIAPDDDDMVAAAEWMKENLPAQTKISFDIGIWAPDSFINSIGTYAQQESKIREMAPQVIAFHKRYMKFYTQMDNKPEDLDAGQGFIDHYWFYVRAETGVYPGYKPLNGFGDILILGRQ